jgi:hypothetical protein
MVRSITSFVILASVFALLALIQVASAGNIKNLMAKNDYFVVHGDPIDDAAAEATLQTY